MESLCPNNNLSTANGNPQQIDWMAPIPKVFCRYIRLNHEKTTSPPFSHWLRNRISVCARFRIWAFSCRLYMPMSASLCVCAVLCMSNVHVYDKVETVVFFCLWFCMAMHWVHFSFHIMNNWNLFLINNTQPKVASDGDKDAFSMCQCMWPFGECSRHRPCARLHTECVCTVHADVCVRPCNVYVPFVWNYTMHCIAVHHCTPVAVDIYAIASPMQIKICLQSINGRAFRAAKQISAKSFSPN